MGRFFKRARPSLIGLFVMVALLSLMPLMVQAAPKGPSTSTTKILAAELMKSFRQYKALKKAGKIREAIPHANRALEYGERAFGRESKTAGTLLNNLGGLYSSLKRYDEAEPLFKRVLLIRTNRIEWHRADLGGKSLADKVSRLRKVLDPTNGTRSLKKTRGLKSIEDEDFNLSLAHELYTKLLQPVENILSDRSRDDNAHTSVWAPFVIVGEGAAR